MVCVCCRQPLCDIVYLLFMQGNAHPCVGIVLDQIQSLTRIDDGQIRTCLCHIGKKVFDTATINDKNIRRLQKFHVFRCQLVIMQAAGLRLAQIFQMYAFHAITDI